MSWDKDIEWRQLVNKETGEIYKDKWPYLNGVKALSPSTILAPLFSLVYGINPPNFTHSGMTDGIEFENALAYFMQTKNIGLSTEMVSNDKIKPRFARLANILNNDRTRIDIDEPFVRNSIGYDRICGRLVACETDMEFPNYILELKKTNMKGKTKLKEYAIKMAYQIQCEIQSFIFGKPVYLVWASDVGITLKVVNNLSPVATYISDKLFEMLDDDSPMEQKVFEIEKVIKYAMEREEELNENNERP